MRIIIECPENVLHLEAGYIYADCPFAQLQPSCSPAVDHTFATRWHTNEGTLAFRSTRRNTRSKRTAHSAAQLLQSFG